MLGQLQKLYIHKGTNSVPDVVMNALKLSTVSSGWWSVVYTDWIWHWLCALKWFKFCDDFSRHEPKYCNRPPHSQVVYLDHCLRDIFSNLITHTKIYNTYRMWTKLRIMGLWVLIIQLAKMNQPCALALPSLCVCIHATKSRRSRGGWVINRSRAGTVPLKETVFTSALLGHVAPFLPLPCYFYPWLLIVVTAAYHLSRATDPCGGLSLRSPLPAPLSCVIRDPLKCQGGTNGSHSLP